MDAIPVEIGVVRLEAGGAGRIGRLYLADRALGDRLRARGETERGRTEIDHAGLLGGLLKTDDVGQRPCDRLVDEDRLAGLQHREHLLEVHAAVVGFQHHEVDLRAELLDRVDDLDAHALEFRRILRDTGSALRDVLAALCERMRHAEAGELGDVGGILRPFVEDRREGHGVRGIEADDADLLRSFFGEERGDHDGREDGHASKAGEGHATL